MTCGFESHHRHHIKGLKPEMVSVLFIEYQIALIALLFIAIQFHFFCAVFIFLCYS